MRRVLLGVLASALLLTGCERGVHVATPAPASEVVPSPAASRSPQVNLSSVQSDLNAAQSGQSRADSAASAAQSAASVDDNG
jgi:hypothetical protein